MSSTPDALDVAIDRLVQAHADDTTVHRTIHDLVSREGR